MRYAVVIEKGPTSYGAHVPDLPACVAAAETRDEVRALIREANELYVETLEEEFDVLLPCTNYTKIQSI